MHVFTGLFDERIELFLGNAGGGHRSRERLERLQRVRRRFELLGDKLLDLPLHLLPRRGGAFADAAFGVGAQGDGESHNRCSGAD
jgi:hypothetical protein